MLRATCRGEQKISRPVVRNYQSGDVVLASSTKFWLATYGIVHGETFPNAEETLRTAQENIAALNKLVPADEERLMLMDIRAANSMTSEARDHFLASNAMKASTRFALLIGSPVSRLMATFYLRLNEQEHPVKVFTSESQALAWL